MKVCITGSAGFIGSKFFSKYKDKYEMFGVSRRASPTTTHQGDITKEEIFKILDIINPQIIIHTAMLPGGVDYHESHKEEAWNVHVRGAKNIAEWAKLNNAKIINISTDYVYEGTKGNYDENSETKPVNYYGETKLEAEKIIDQLINNAAHLRTTVVYGFEKDGKNFLMQCLQNSTIGREMRIPQDQISNPTHIDTLLNYIDRVIEKNLMGVYVATGKEAIGRNDFCKMIIKTFNLREELFKAVKTSELKQIAKRPLNNSTNSSKIQIDTQYTPLSAQEYLDMEKSLMDKEPERIEQQILDLATKFYKTRFGEQKFFAGKTKIDPSGKLFDDKEIRNGISSILDGWWTEGRFAKAFEKKLASFMGAKKVILTNSGSSANLAAFYALTSPKLKERRIMLGDEVITIATAFPTTVAPIIQAGAIPVFLDIEPLERGSYNIDVSKLELALTNKTKAVVIAHTLGNPFNLSVIKDFCNKNRLWLIEDGCDALGSKWDGKMVGTFGDVSTLSFYPAHHITMGEGGAVIVNDIRLARIVESFRNWGRDCWCETGKDNTCKKRYDWQLGSLPRGYDHKNIYTHMGFNLKLTDMQASIGLAQLDKVESFINKRKENFKFLYDGLKKYEEELILPSALPEADPSWFGFIISIRENAPFTREEMTSYLESKGIGSRALFSGNLTRHPGVASTNYRIVGDLKNSDRAMNNTFWIGVQPNITEEKRQYILKNIEEFIENKKKSSFFKVGETKSIDLDGDGKEDAEVTVSSIEGEIVKLIIKKVKERNDEKDSDELNLV